MLETRSFRRILRIVFNTVNKNDLAENFDALTGKPIRDQSYIWTSSVFII